jgi:hypothetical protein
VHATLRKWDVHVIKSLPTSLKVININNKEKNTEALLHVSKKVGQEIKCREEYVYINASVPECRREL